MARKRHKHWKNQSQPRDGQSYSNNTSIEDDLRLQRRRQKDRLDKKQGESEFKPSDEVEDENDTGIEIPTPSHLSKLLPQQWTIRGDVLRWPDYIPEMSSLWGIYLMQSSSALSVHRRSRLGYWTAAKHLLENVQVNSRASTMYSKKMKWVNHALPSDMNCAWDLTCKHHLHSSARTLDVGLIQSEHFESIEGLPTIATTLQGGWGLHQPPMEGREQRIHTLRWYVS